MGQREKTIIIILDESENMNKDDLDKIKQVTFTLGFVSSDLDITLWKFGTDTENAFSAQPLSLMQTYSNYEPSGKAALFDSIYNVIAAEYDKENVLCLIATSGIDDCSVECDLDMIRGTMEEMEKEKGWVFVFTNSDFVTHLTLAQARAHASHMQDIRTNTALNGIMKRRLLDDRKRQTHRGVMRELVNQVGVEQEEDNMQE